jgi:NADH dehydrogenase
VSEGPKTENVLVTGATGFVGSAVVRELVVRGLTPVCLVRSPEKLLRRHRDISPERIRCVAGDLHDDRALANAADQCDAAIHLVGIILEKPFARQTFDRIHRQGTEHVVNAVRAAGITRYVHMSALGSRPNAEAKYHKTKWAAEEYVRGSGLDWTIFRPSLIHGPDGEFMRLMKMFMCGLVPPVVPYFGDGRAKLQPVSVKDVAYCFVEALFRPETIGQAIDLGGPRAYSWKELYNACRTFMPCAKQWKPMVSQPVAVAKLAAVLSGPPLALAAAISPKMGLLRFNVDQVIMSQEDNVCDHTAAERALGLTMRSFEDELSTYAGQIR